MPIDESLPITKTDITSNGILNSNGGYTEIKSTTIRESISVTGVIVVTNDEGMLISKTTIKNLIGQD